MRCISLVSCCICLDVSVYRHVCLALRLFPTPTNFLESWLISTKFDRGMKVQGGGREKEKKKNNITQNQSFQN